jgi:hypothetical protein
VIRQHDFNTRWWGQPAGIVDDGAFFSLPDAERSRALAPFQWVEFKCRLHEAPPLARLRAAGFVLADTQVEFRIGLGRRTISAGADSLGVRSAGNAAFVVRAEEMAPFEHERFRHLPGYEPARASLRYCEWSRELIHDHPDTCLEFTLGDAVQGWFLSRPASGGLNLTLAMLHRSAKISGFLLYEKALEAYAERGHRVGWAGFSVTNTAVLNIYSKLGAQFIAPVGIWLWCRTSTGV